MPKGVMGNMSDMMDMMQTCITDDMPMPVEDVQKMMDMAQSAHEAMTGEKKPMSDKAAKPPSKKAGVAYL